MKNERFLKIGFGLVLLAIAVWHWMSDTIVPNQLISVVEHPYHWDFLETRYLYWGLLGFCCLPIVFFNWVLGIGFFERWRQLLLGLVVVAVPFWIWDIYVTGRGVWGFNALYYTRLLINLPVEEWLFFLIIPFACVFIYHCLHFYKCPDLLKRVEPFIGWVIVLVSGLMVILYWGRSYTAPTFLFSFGAALFHQLFLSGRYRSRFYLAFVLSLIPMLLVDGILTGMASLHPVVMYNPDEYLGWRLVTIPVEDLVYNYVMMLGVVTVYEEGNY
jgi:lycopene cyclase domain-containing protein